MPFVLYLSQESLSAESEAHTSASPAFSTTQQCRKGTSRAMREMAPAFLCNSMPRMPPTPVREATQKADSIAVAGAYRKGLIHVAVAKCAPATGINHGAEKLCLCARWWEDSRAAVEVTVMPLAKRITDCFKSGRQDAKHRRQVGLASGLDFESRRKFCRTRARMCRVFIPVLSESAWNVQII